MNIDHLSLLEDYIKKHNFAGWDIFDGLNSQFFKRSGLSRFSLFRLAWIQLFKRSPINFRRIAFVPPGLNPKALALFAAGHVLLGRLQEAEKLLQQLDELKHSGSDGVGWGYNFPWQARAFYVPRHKPNMVVTAFVAQAMLDYYEATRDEKWLELVKSCCWFIINNLLLHEDDQVACFGYIPGETARVHNANLMGAALLGRVHAYAGEQRFYELSGKSAAYSVAALSPEHLWPYGERSHHKFVDNFHTGFNLVALKQWMEATGEIEYEPKVIAAYKKYLDVFWLEDGSPRYYHDRLYPIDIHNCAQGIVTCLYLSEYDDRSLKMAEKIASWAINNMQDSTGYFYYQKTRWYTNKIPYMRWSQAWMFYALANYISYAKGNPGKLNIS